MDRAIYLRRLKDYIESHSFPAMIVGDSVVFETPWVHQTTGETGYETCRASTFVEARRILGY